MNDRAPAPGGLALIQSLVNTLDIESGADETPRGLIRRDHDGVSLLAPERDLVGVDREHLSLDLAVGRVDHL